MEKKVKIYRVSVSLTSKGWKVLISEPMDMKETDKSYTCKTSRIGKDALLQPLTIFLEYPLIYKHHTYCKADDVFLAEQGLKEHILKRFEEDKDGIQAISKALHP